MPLPLLGAEVAPKAPALFPPAPAPTESSTLEFRFRSPKSGGKTAGAGAGGAAALKALAITDFGAIGAFNGAMALTGAGAVALADPGAVMEAMDGREAGLGLMVLPLLLLKAVVAWLLVVVVIAEAWVRLCDDLATDADAEADADEDESDEEVAFELLAYELCCTAEVVAW